MRPSKGLVRDEGKDSAHKRPSRLISASLFLLGNSYNREAGLTDLATNRTGAVRLRAKYSTYRLSRRARKRLEAETKRAPSHFNFKYNLLTILSLDHRRLEAQITNFHAKKRATWAKTRALENSLMLNSMTSLAHIPKKRRRGQSIFSSGGTNFGRS